MKENKAFLSSPVLGPYVLEKVVMAQSKELVAGGISSEMRGVHMLLAGIV